MHLSMDVSVKVGKNAVKGYVKHVDRKRYEEMGVYINHSNEDINRDMIARNVTYTFNNVDGYGDNAMDRYERRMADYDARNKDGSHRKMRSDAVVLRPILIQPSAHIFEGKTVDEKKEIMHRFVVDSMAYFQENFCSDTRNYVGVYVHLDETNPHAHIPFIPMTEDGRLSQKDYFKNPTQLKVMHRQYREHMQAKGWDVELDNKHEDSKHYEQADYKRNAKAIEEARTAYTQKKRALTSDKQVQKDAVGQVMVNIQNNDALLSKVGANAVIQLRNELLEKERQLEEREERLKRFELDAEVKLYADMIFKYRDDKVMSSGIKQVINQRYADGKMYNGAKAIADRKLASFNEFMLQREDDAQAKYDKAMREQGGLER